MDLEKTGERVKYSRDKPKGFYKLFVNDKNEFTRLDDKFKRMKENISKLIGDVVKSQSMINPQKGRTKMVTKMKVLENLILLAQSVIFVTITRFVNDIEDNIKSIDDREALYHRLPDLLTASNKLNEIIFPELLNRAIHREQEIEEGEGAYKENVGHVCANIVTNITKIIEVSKPGSRNSI